MVSGPGHVLCAPRRELVHNIILKMLWHAISVQLPRLQGGRILYIEVDWRQPQARKSNDASIVVARTVRPTLGCIGLASD